MYFTGCQTTSPVIRFLVFFGLFAAATYVYDFYCHPADSMQSFLLSCLYKPLKHQRCFVMMLCHILTCKDG